MEDFADIDGWTLHCRRTDNCNISLSENEIPARSGSGTYIQTQYRGDKGSGFRLMKDRPIFLEGCTFQLSIDVFGYGEIMEFYADFRDARNKFHRVPAGILKHKGWKTITIPPSGIRSRRVQLNRGRDGIYLEGFYFKTENADGKLRLLLDNIISKSGPCIMETKKRPSK